MDTLQYKICKKDANIKLKKKNTLSKFTCSQMETGQAASEYYTENIIIGIAKNYKYRKRIL